MSRTNKLFMAVAKGRSTDVTEIKRYIGVAPVFINAVNPSKKELESLYNTTIDNEPKYLGEIEVNEKKIPNVRIDFIVTTDEKAVNVGLRSRVSFFIRNEYRYNRDKTKVQVIDKYGRTAWVTIEQAKNHEIPIYSNGPANLDKDYRPIYYGEEQLTEFIKAYLGIPPVMKYVNDTWVITEHPEECEVRLDKIADYFKNDFSELKEIITYQPNNKVRVLFGVRTTDDNKMYQSVFTELFLKNSNTDYTKLAKVVKERKEAGAYATTEFEVCDLKEYVVKPTELPASTPVDDDLPMSNPWE